MPNKPKYPGHMIRVPTDLWNAAVQKARADNENNMSRVIREFLTTYISKDTP